MLRAGDARTRGQQVEHALWETLQMFSDKKGGSGGSGPVGLQGGEWHGLQFPTVEPPPGSTTELANPTPRNASHLNFCNWVCNPTHTLSHHHINHTIQRLHRRSRQLPSPDPLTPTHHPRYVPFPRLPQQAGNTGLHRVGR
jgi:hypothetical protein